VGQIAGDAIQIALGLRGEHRIKPLAELVERQPALRIVLPQLSGY
jgi:hypothetical protein